MHNLNLGSMGYPYVTRLLTLATFNVRSLVWNGRERIVIRWSLLNRIQVGDRIFDQLDTPLGFVVYPYTLIAASPKRTREMPFMVDYHCTHCIYNIRRLKLLQLSFSDSC